MKLKTLCLLLLFCWQTQAQDVDTSIRYIHQEPTTFLATITKLSLRIFQGLRQICPGDILNELSKEEAKAARMPGKFAREFQVDTFKIQGRKVYAISPKNKRSEKYILYIHGGAYIGNILKQHWKLIGELVRSTQATILVPDYPLAPIHTMEESMDFMGLVYQNMLLKAKSQQIIIMGDSAGGGFSLAFSQKLRKENKPQPTQIILLAPWLDISTSNPEMVILEKKDPMLRINNLQSAGKAWAGKTDIKNYLVSPLYGDFDSLGKISIFIGGEDILKADCKKMKAIMEQQNISINYFEYPEMFHVWMAATFLKESKIAVRQISKLVLDQEL